MPSMQLLISRSWSKLDPAEALSIHVYVFRYSFDKRVRMGADNPTIADMARVKCPPELVELTQVQRADDPDTYEIMEENRPSAYQGRSRVSPRRSVPMTFTFSGSMFIFRKMYLLPDRSTIASGRRDICVSLLASSPIP